MLSNALLDEFNGERIFEILPFVGSDGGQYAVHNVRYGQPHLYGPGYSDGPEQTSKSKIVTVDMDVQIVEIAQAVKPEHIPIKQTGHGPNEKGNGDQARHYGV